MRNIVFAVLAVNILFFLWPKENQEPRPELSRGKDGLPILIQLVEVDERPDPASIVPEKFVPIVQPPPRTVRVPVPQPKYARVKAPAPSASASSPAEQVASSGLKPEQPGTAQEKNPMEKGLASLPDLNVETKPRADSKSTVQSCYTLGPFADRKAADKAAEQLRAVGASTSLRTSSERRTRGYWVYLPKQKSREQALQKAEELAAKGFSDYFVVADGEHDNAVSLGLFTLKKGSERRVEKLKSMGFNAKVEVRFTELSVFWLDYETDQDLDWSAFIKDKFPKGRIDLLKRSCT